MIKMNIPVIFQFLKDLSANNNREWFNEHKAEYELARAEFDNFLATVIARISLFDETIRLSLNLNTAVPVIFCNLGITFHDISVGVYPSVYFMIQLATSGFRF